ncbi:glycosyltransferase [Ciceribacter sp. L1K22]|uniref:glycosyltransferase n=1 Tax=Ciceribacter sp. L1K22 TaxID=2820275 RepID=UPI001ABE239F|nr:glycosyltransferase [Ciceribacter sp. L1K22]MBO3759788.1 glycosyltransferase [Ciceribacter sp. L1K22]
MPAMIDRPMRLLQVLEPSGGGSGRHFIDLCGALKDRGHQVTAVYSPVRAEDRFVRELTALELENVVALPMRRAVGPWDAAAWFDLHRLIKTLGPFDLIHGHSSKAGALTRVRLPGRHVPRVYTPHALRTMDPTLGRKGRTLFGTIESFLGRYFSDRIICVSEDERDHAVTLDIPANKLRVVINGVLTPPREDRLALRRSMGVPEDAVVFGFVGRLSAQKGPERLVNAFVKAASAAPDIHLAMIGFGEMEAMLRETIDRAGLSDRFLLRHDIPGSTAMQAFDILVMPSRYEAMSYVALEAAASGLPMILTETGGSSVVLADGVNGVLIPNEDRTDALVDAMLTAVNPDRRTAFAAAAAARRHQFTLETMVERTLQVYRELVAD